MSKKIYTLVAALLSLSILTACSNNNTETKKETMKKTGSETFLESDSQNEGKNEVHKFEANITEINENKLTVSLNDNYDEGNSGETLIVIIPTDNNYNIKVGDNIEVEYDGIMMSSYPGQIVASNITVLDGSNLNNQTRYKFDATIVEITDNSLTVTPNPESKEGKVNKTIVVNLSKDVSYDVKNGDNIEIEYNGMMTRSIPPQISATNITLLDGSETVKE